MPFRKWDPLKDLILLHQDLFGEAAELAMAEPTRGGWSPVVDIYETPSAYVLKVEVPGVDPAQIHLEFREQKIIITGERPAHHREGNRRYHHVERVYGPFERTITLPPHVCCQEIEAQYKDGVLEVIVPKQAVAGPQSVRVQSGPGA